MKIRENEEMILAEILLAWSLWTERMDILHASFGVVNPPNDPPQRDGELPFQEAEPDPPQPNPNTNPKRGLGRPRKMDVSRDKQVVRKPNEDATQPKPRKHPSARDRSWLPEGWTIIKKTRQNGASAGHVDVYYVDPCSGCQFRSKIEVLDFLKTGTSHKRKKGLENSDANTDVKEQLGLGTLVEQLEWSIRFISALNSWNVYRPKPGLAQPDQHHTGTLTPNPLLKFGSFIDANNLPNGETPIKKRSLKPKVNAEKPETSKQRRRSTVADTAAWLPLGWLVEDRIRNSGATAVMVDKYYIDPRTGRQFRYGRVLFAYRNLA